MSYENRYGNRYYYERRKVGGKMVTRFVVNALEAERINQDVQKRKASALARRNALASLRSRLNAVEAHVVAYHTASDLIYHDWKLATSFHLHNRQWRKTGITMIAKLSPEEREKRRQLERDLARREFNAGDVDALIEKYGATPVTTSLESLLQSMTDDEFKREAYRHAFRKLRRGLEGEQPTLIQHLLASKCALQWIDCNFRAALFFMSSHDVDTQRAEFLDRSRTRASRRLIRSIKALADSLKSTSDEVEDTLKRFEFSSN